MKIWKKKKWKKIRNRAKNSRWDHYIILLIFNRYGLTKMKHIKDCKKNPFFHQNKIKKNKRVRRKGEIVLGKMYKFLLFWIRKIFKNCTSFPTLKKNSHIFTFLQFEDSLFLNKKILYLHLLFSYSFFHWNQSKIDILSHFSIIPSLSCVPESSIKNSIKK